MKKMMTFAVLLVLLSGCACSSNGDPTKGGIFFNEKAAERRLEEKRRQLDEQQTEGRQLDDEGTELENERECLKEEITQQRIILDALETKLEKLKQTIQQYETRTKEKQQEKEELELKTKATRSAINELRHTTTLTVEEREHEIEILQQEIETLLEIAGSL